jgi:hypothetical protein
VHPERPPARPQPARTFAAGNVHSQRDRERLSEALHSYTPLALDMQQWRGLGPLPDRSRRWCGSSPASAGADLLRERIGCTSATWPVAFVVVPWPPPLEL